MYFSIINEKFLLLRNRYIAPTKNSNTGTSSVWINPGMRSKWGIIEMKKRKYKGERLKAYLFITPIIKDIT